MSPLPFDEDNHPFDTKVHWTKTDDAEFPYTAQVDGHTWTIRVNDWPDEPTVFSLLVDDVEYLHFNDWSTRWKKPR